MRLNVLRRALRSRKPGHRLATFVLVAGCFALQLTGELHLAVVEHNLCLEHGDVVDGAAGHAHVHGGAAHAPSANDEVESGRGDEGGSGGSHDHCPLTQDRGGRPLLVQGALPGPRVQALRVVMQPRVALWSPAPNALRLLAPKTSPPV